MPAGAVPYTGESIRRGALQEKDKDGSGSKNPKSGQFTFAQQPHGGRKAAQMPRGYLRYKPPVSSALSCRRLRQGFRRAVKL